MLKEESNEGSPENRVDFMELTAATTLVDVTATGSY